MLAIGNFPDNMKLADITPVFKKKYPLQKEDYRPVSVPSAVSDGSSICRWTGNEDLYYGISRFWEKYSRKAVFSTLGGVGNSWKK